jgi:hypothetical protein
VAQIKITELPSATSISDLDLLLLVQGGLTKQLPYSALVGAAGLAERIRDVVGVAVSAGATNVVAQVDDTGDQINFVAVDATGAIKGVVRLANALGGSATSPTALGLNDQTELVELIRDTVGSTLVPGANVSIIPDDAGNTIVIASSGGGGGGTGGPVTIADITDATPIGKQLLAIATQAAGRTAIGAGTSDLALGTTSTTAAAGNHTHTAAGVTDLAAAVNALIGAAVTGGDGIDVVYDPTTGETSISNTYQQRIANAAPGAMFTVRKDPVTGFWPIGYDALGNSLYTGGSATAGVRPTSRQDIYITWRGPDPSPASVASGTGGPIRDVDDRSIPNG